MFKNKKVQEAKEVQTGRYMLVAGEIYYIGLTGVIRDGKILLGGEHGVWPNKTGVTVTCEPNTLITTYSK